MNNLFSQDIGLAIYLYLVAHRVFGWWFQPGYQSWLGFFLPAFFTYYLGSRPLRTWCFWLGREAWGPWAQASVPAPADRTSSLRGIVAVLFGILTYILLHCAFLALVYELNDWSSNDDFALDNDFLFAAAVLLQVCLGWLEPLLRPTSRLAAWLAGCLLVPAIAAGYFLQTAAADQVVSFSPKHLGILSSQAVAFGVILGTANLARGADRVNGLTAGLAIQVSLALLSLMYWAGIYPEAWGYRVKPDPTPALLCWAALGGSTAAWELSRRGSGQTAFGGAGSLAVGAALAMALVVSHALVLLPFFGFVWFAVPLTRMAIGLWSRRKTGGRLPGKLSNFSHWSESRVLLTLAGINACTISLGLLFWWAGYLPQYP